MKLDVLFTVFLLSLTLGYSQDVSDDFEGSGTISSWFGDDCNMNISFSNPYVSGINTSSTVLQYHDVGGQFANVRFDVSPNFDLMSKNTFTLKIYVPSSGITGSQPNQISLKLQDGTLAQPWSTQSEIIKPIELDQWQEVSFNFETDNFINLDGNSPPPVQRTDFNRVVIQVNGENNNDEVLAYIDDILYLNTEDTGPEFNTLVWSDEFNGTGALDASKWYHQTEFPVGTSWFNGEIQHYTNRTDNSYMSGGSLHLVAKKESFNDQGVTKEYTSARLNSKFAFTYGRVEIRAKLPSGVGTWPALWMLGQNITENGAYWETQGFGTTGWPACGEIDIMEHWGDNQDFVQSAMHTPSSFGATVNFGGQVIPNASTTFHVYALEWTDEKMVFSVDDVVHYTYDPPVKDANTWPFDANQYLLFNIAILPNIAPSFTESTMEIDYIRVYQEDLLSTPEATLANGIKIFPNPSNSQVTVTLPETLIGAEVKITSLVGQELLSYKQTNASNRLDISEYPSGLYIVNVLSGEKRYTFKLVKR